MGDASKTAWWKLVINWLAIITGPVWIGTFMLVMFVKDACRQPDGSARRVMQGKETFW
jgi:uncharacterized membrane protein